MVSRCDICNDVLSANIRLNSNLNFGNGSQFCDGYTICGSAGHVSQDSVKRYILEQEGKDVFDYNIYGCPSDKDIRIGNFTQSKLEVN